MLARLALICGLVLAAAIPSYSQTPTPFYSLTFANIPSAAANGTSAYLWEPFDESDVPCSINQYHTGLITLAGGLGQGQTYSDPQYLNLSQSSGPYSVDNVLPTIFGPSSAGGWSVEVTFKAGLQAQFSKLIDIGSIRPNSNCNNDFYLGWNFDSQNYAVGMCEDANTTNGASNGNNNLNPLFVAGQWYHVVIVIDQLGDGMTNGNGQGNWYYYVNGAAAGQLLNTTYPQAVARQNALIGNSNWGDPTWAGIIDTFNIYNTNLTATQVASLSAAALGSSTPTLACTTISTATVVPATAVYYSNTFDVSPIATNSISNPTYQWVNTDLTDSTAQQSLHQGLILLNGTNNPLGGWANMSAASGPASVAPRSGAVLGAVGGEGTGSISDGTLGWSFEVVYKPFTIDNFGKIYDITNGAGGGGIDDILYGYNSDSGDFECDYVNGVYTSGAAQYILTPAGPTKSTLQLNSVWYHHVWVIQYNSTLSFATAANKSTTSDLGQYYSYLNGQLINTLPNAVYPPYIYRYNSFLGRSAWNDTAWQGYVDTFRVYSTALTAGQVNTLYQQAQVTGVVTAPGSSSSSGASAASSSSMSAASGSSSGSAASAMSSSSAASGSSSGAAAAASSSSSTAAVVVASSSSSSAASAVQSSSSSTAAAVTVQSSSSSSAASTVVPSSSSSTASVVVSPTAATSASSSTVVVGQSSSSTVVSVASSTGGAVSPSTVNGASSSSSSRMAAVAVAVMAVLALLL